MYDINGALMCIALCRCVRTHGLERFYTDKHSCAQVTAISTSPNKEAEAKGFGAKNFVVSGSDAEKAMINTQVWALIPFLMRGSSVPCVFLPRMILVVDPF